MCSPSSAIRRPFDGTGFSYRAWRHVGQSLWSLTQALRHSRQKMCLQSVDVASVMVVRQIGHSAASSSERYASFDGNAIVVECA